MQEYLLGKCAFIPDDGFRLKLTKSSGGNPLLEFTVITGRTYTIHSSTNLQTWAPMSFKIPANGPADRGSYTATDVGVLQVEPQLPGGGPGHHSYFKLQVQ